MRIVNPTAMATILRLIGCLIIDPENLFKVSRVRVLEMALSPLRSDDCNLILPSRHSQAGADV
jgi:hypothetical protein